MPSAVRPTNAPRVTMLMRTNLLMNSIRANQVDLLKVQDQLTSGLKIARPSDSPGEATTVMQLDSAIERQKQYVQNIGFANDYLSATDMALGQAVSLVSEAYAQALAGMNSGGVVEGGYDAMAQMIDGVINQMITIGNTICRNGYVFGGQNDASAPFTADAGGILFGGSMAVRQTRVSDDTRVAFSVSAAEAFGAMSSEVVGVADLDPSITPATLLSDLNGATNQGVRLGAIRISDGVNVMTVDLGGCVTVGDVIDKINAATPATTTAAVAADGNSLRIESTLGNLVITEVATGSTARDLGIYEPLGAAVIDGQDVDARLTLTTPVTALAGGAGIDLASGIRIQNSLLAEIPPVSFAGAATVGDILNRINSAGVGAYAEINSNGTGINVHNVMSGSSLTIGENGGATAADLGIRSLHGATPLAALNNGAGVATAEGAVRVTARDGSEFTVALDGAANVQDVVTMINTAAAAAGVAVSAALNAHGNGWELTDATGGAGSFSVFTASANGYDVAAQLGLSGSVDADTLNGTDVNPVQADSVFTHLIALRDALQRGDTAAIAQAGEALKGFEQQLTSLHGKVGSQVRALEDRLERTQDNVLLLERLRSDIRDIDFSEAVTRYQNLYTALQANLMTGGQMGNLSLLDFLR